MQYLTLDVGGSGIKHALADDSYGLTAKGLLPTSYDSHGAFVEAVGGIFDRVRGQVAGIAISSCGEVDPDSGQMLSGGTLTFNAGTNMVESVAARCGVPVSVENDANCALLAEVQSGCLMGSKDAVVLVIGTAVGGAILINGQVHRGAHFHSGNASFTKVNLKDRASPQLEATNGVGALLAHYARSAGIPIDTLDGRVFFERVPSDARARDALEEFCARLGHFIFNLQVILDVGVIAIGGGISAQPVFLDVLRQKVDESFESATVELPRPQIRSCRYFNDANLIGALHHHLTQMSGTRRP